MYLRLYSGSIRPQSTIYNLSKRKKLMCTCIRDYGTLKIMFLMLTQREGDSCSCDAG